MNDASITESGVVRGSVHKRGYGHKQATATPSVAGVSEAGDCGGKPDAGRVGVAGGAALRRERQSGFRLAAALSRRCGGAGRASLAARDSDAGSSRGDGTRASELIEIVLAGGYRLRVGEGVQASTLRLVLDVLERR